MAAEAATAEGSAATTTAARGAPTPENFWALTAQVNGMQSAINALVTQNMETTRKAAASEEYAKQRVGQYDDELAKLRDILDNLKVDEAVAEVQQAEENMKTMAMDAKAMVEEWRNLGGGGGKGNVSGALSL